MSTRTQASSGTTSIIVIIVPLVYPIDVHMTLAAVTIRQRFEGYLEFFFCHSIIEIIVPRNLIFGIQVFVSTPMSNPRPVIMQHFHENQSLFNVFVYENLIFLIARETQSTV
jgi:hypothetical protein|tara:strand:- start:407 stop:742 length:336 start_codon:yes stop_codon:yes gene_type:complete